MTGSTRSPDGTAARSRRGRALRGGGVPVAAALSAPLLLGVVIGIAWWALAPTATVVALPDHTLASQRAPEFAAAQAGVLSLLGAGAGLLCAVFAALSRVVSRWPVRGSLAVVVASAAGSAIAAGAGHLLGPASVADQRSAHPKAALVSPLTIHSPVVLLVWPAVAALALAIAHLVAARRQAEATTSWSSGQASLTPPEPGERPQPW